MSLCESIDTLAMAYLDDELATEERRELELHVVECASCRGLLEAERAEHSQVRRALVAPPAPDLLRAKVMRELDREDRAARTRWTRWLLPGSAMVAAAAAILVFVGMPMHSERAASEVARDAMHVQMRALPYDVQGPSTGSFMQQAAIDLPARLQGRWLGGREVRVMGHDAVMAKAQAAIDGQPFQLSVVAIKGMRGSELEAGDEVTVHGHTVHVMADDEGRFAVSFTNRNNIGYVFVAPDLTLDQLLDVVGEFLQ